MKKKQDVFTKIIDEARMYGGKIVLPEADDSRIIEAAKIASTSDLCTVILLGDESIEKNFTKKELKNIKIINPKFGTNYSELYAQKLFELRKHKGMTLDKAKEAVKDNITYAMMMISSGDADGVVAGATHETAVVLRSAFQIVGTKPGVSRVSSVFIMEMREDSNLGENGMMVFGDCAVNIMPNDEELAEIAVLSAETAEKICKIHPNVALLSWTTRADENFDNERIQTIKRAYKIARRKNPVLQIDGEMQADAALSPFVSEHKCPGSIVGGKANVLIFPDLYAGNIGYKLVQRIAGVRAVGPIMQGLNKPVNDLSRGTTAEEIVLNMAITILQSRR